MYETITASLFAVFSLLFFLNVKYLNVLFGIALALFPIVVIATHHPIEALKLQLLAGAVFFGIGIILMVTAGIGGGVVKGLAIIALWTPTSFLFPVITLMLIGNGVYAAGYMAVKKYNTDLNDTLDYFAAVMFAIAAAVMYYNSDLSLL